MLNSDSEREDRWERCVAEEDCIVLFSTKVQTGETKDKARVGINIAKVVFSVELSRRCSESGSESAKLEYCRQGDSASALACTTAYIGRQ